MSGDTEGEGTVEGTAGSADAILAELWDVIESRKAERPEDSYTASLFEHEKGEDAILEKLGEEGTEFLLAAKGNDEDAVAHEAADLVYHLLVLLSAKGMDLEDLTTELRERRG